MNDTDIPIVKKTYDLYRYFSQHRITIPKQDRYTLWQRSENYLLDVLEGILLASQSQKASKIPLLEQASMKLNMLRIFIRLMKDTKSLDAKKYVTLEAAVDEIGRMLGGWIRSSRNL